MLSGEGFVQNHGPTETTAEFQAFVQRPRASVPNRFPGRQPPPPEPMEIDGEIEYAFRCWLTCELFYLV